jgi:hypothetical protein
MKSRMDKIESQVMPAPPNLISSLKAGFDAVANQIVIILIPITVDIFLWLGPHLQIKTIAEGIIRLLSSSADLNNVQNGEIYTSSLEILRNATGQFNILSLLRTIPVGIPSLMAPQAALGTPSGMAMLIDVTHPLILFGIVIGLIVIGLGAGCFYYILVVQAALQGKINLRHGVKNWPWTSLQVLSLTVALLIIFLVISIPSSCAISAMALFGLPLGQFAIFLYIGVLLWLTFPLVFSAHGIFINHNNAFISVLRSMIMTRMTLPTTSLFILVILALSEGLDLLWKVPPSTSWLTLIGVGGHAFISSALLAASFVYYRDADQWTQETLRKIKSQRVTLA